MNPATITSDLAAIFTDGLQKTVTHTYGETTETLYGFFEKMPQIVAPNGVTISAERPRLIVRASDAANISKSSEFTIDAVSYFVFEIQPATAAILTIYLSEDENG